MDSLVVSDAFVEALELLDLKDEQDDGGEEEQ